MKSSKAIVLKELSVTFFEVTRSLTCGGEGKTVVGVIPAKGQSRTASNSTSGLKLLYKITY